MQWKKSNRRTWNHHTNINDRHIFPSIWQVAAQLRRPCLKIAEDRSPWRVYNSTNSTKISAVSNLLYTVSQKVQKMTIAALVMMVYVRVVCHSPAVVLHGCLVALALTTRSFALALVDTHFQSVPLLPRPITQNAPRSLWCWSEKQKLSFRESSIRLFPARRRSVRNFFEVYRALPCRKNEFFTLVLLWMVFFVLQTTPQRLPVSMFIIHHRCLPVTLRNLVRVLLGCVDIHRKNRRKEKKMLSTREVAGFAGMDSTAELRPAVWFVVFISVVFAWSKVPPLY